MENFISLRDFANKLGYSYKTIHTRIKRKGLRDYCKLAYMGYGNKVLVIPIEHMDKFNEEFKDELIIRISQSKVTEGALPSLELGCFYFIQPIPKDNPKKIKLGFAISLNKRFNGFKTIIGNEFNVVGTFPCKPEWEKNAISCITKEDCTLIEGTTELFECENIDKALERCKTFFALMPEIKINEPEKEKSQDEEDC